MSGPYAMAAFVDAVFSGRVSSGAAARAPSPGPVIVLDLDSTASGGDPYAELESQSVMAKQIAAATAVAQGATDGGSSAVADAYHAGLVPPSCLAAVKDFFATR